MPDLNRRFPRYSRLLRLYPRAYRARYAEPILQTLADMLDDPAANRAGVWLKIGADLPASLARQQFTYLADIMTRQTPSYVKTASLASALMMVPFALAITANALIPGHLYHSWAWQYRYLVVWVLILPAVAAALSLTTFSVWAIDRRRAGTSLWRSAGDLARNWPMLLTLGAGLFIVALALFHDSVHCVTGNPLTELQNWHQTLRCIVER